MTAETWTLKQESRKLRRVYAALCLRNELLERVLVKRMRQTWRQETITPRHGSETG